jgi:hypothetical protein
MGRGYVSSGATTAMAAPPRRPPAARLLAAFPAALLTALLAALLLAPAPALAAAPEAPANLEAKPIVATTATLNGVLNPGAPGTPGTYEFRYRQSATECTGENEKATPAEVALGLEKEAVKAEVTGLLPLMPYTFCLLARNEAGEEALSAPVTFSALAEPPAVEGETVHRVLITEATVGARINPEGQATTYHVEYGPSESYGQSTPETSVGAAGYAAVGVQVRLSGLRTGTTYHYRFVATNASHEATRDEEGQTFTTEPAPPAPGSEHCEELYRSQPPRTGPSANLPDCRAYELVTPADKGRTQDLLFTQGNDYAIPSSDGEHIALETLVPLEPNPSSPADVNGAQLVFSRTSNGWEARSAAAPGTGAERMGMQLFSPDLSQVALMWNTQSNFEEHSPDVTYEVGPVGGPYAVVARAPRQGNELPRTYFQGASRDFSHVLLSSTDHALPLLSRAEEAVAEGTVDGAPNLYDWTHGHLQLVNVTSAGSLVSLCGAILGDGSTGEERAADGAVSEDGSKIFFTTERSGPGCEEAGRLYMRVDGRETVEVSASPGVRYNGATPDGSEVVFESEDKLFLYSTQAREGERLTRIASGVIESDGALDVVLAEEGTAVYYETGQREGSFSIYRYDVGTKTTRFVATAERSDRGEPFYATPNGEFFAFYSLGVAGEPRGSGRKELYRYDNADGSVMCVSCGYGDAPAEGETVEPGAFTALLETTDEVPAVIPISSDGRYAFFETSARLVSQDTNQTTDVYEWEADGAGGCVLPQGCTYLLSSGEDVGPSVFLGASAGGRDVFFATAAQLAPQDTDEFGDIYDARVGGGFPPRPPAPECLSCQGVGSPPPLFAPGASLTFAGAGNPVAPVSKPVAKPKGCRKGYVKRKGRCVRRKSKKRAKRSTVHSAKGGKRS